jgi:hypothetical protein
MTTTTITPAATREQPAQEHLTHGWEPETPDADSIVRRFVNHWADQSVAFATTSGGTAVRTSRFVLADYRRPSGLFNLTTLLAPPTDWDALLDGLDPLLAGGTGGMLLSSLWPTPNLRRRGWALIGHPPLLIRPPTALAPVEPPDPAPRAVRTAAELAVWEDVAVRAYGYPLDELSGGPPGRFADPGLLRNHRLRFWITEQDGAPASVSAHYVSRGIASLAFGATLRSARGRGHWSRHARTRLLAQPQLWHAGVFSDDSRPLAQRLGFIPIVRFTLWHLPRNHSSKEQ